MQTNAVPHYDDSVNTTGCCPKFNPDGWDGQALHFEDKAFVRATTKSVMHMPVNMGRVFGRIQAAISFAGAYDSDDFIVLSRDLSPWLSEHLFAVSGPVPNEEAVRLSGDFITRVFEGPYRNVKEWHGDMQNLARARGGSGDDVYFFYTTCPKCAKAFGRNYVVGVARVS